MRCADYLQPIRDTQISVFDAPLVKKISRRAAHAKGRRFGNYIVQFLSLLFNRGIDEGHTRVNPAAKVKKIKAPKNAPQPNRPWKDKEREEVLAALPSHVRLPVSLMMFCALDPQDALQLKRSVIRNGEIDTRRGKTVNPVFIPLPKPVLEAMRAQQQHNSVTVCANSFGQPWTASGFRAVRRRIRLQLEAKGRIDPGLTLKGLRHTVATILREMGKDHGEIADMLGQSTEAMARHYSRRADMTEKNSATISDLSAEMDKRRTKVVKPIRNSVKPKD